MHAVCHVRHRHFDLRPSRKQRLEDSAADLTVQLTDAIDGAAAPDGQISHIKRLGRIVRGHAVRVRADPANEIESSFSAYVLKYFSIRSGAKRSKPASTGVWVVKRFPARVIVRARSNGCLLLGHVRPGSLKHRERGMTLVEMADFRMQAEGPQEPPASNSQDQLLLQAQLRTAAVEFAGNAAVRRNIRRIVGVQQIQFRSAHLHLPGANPKLARRKVDRQAQPFAIWLAQRFDGQLAGVVEGI